MRRYVGKVTAPGRPHARLAGQVEDRVARLQQACQLDGRKVCLDEPEAGSPQQRRDVVSFQLDVVVIGERVDSGDARSGIQQFRTQMRPDESGRTGHDCTHDFPPI